MGTFADTFTTAIDPLWAVVPGSDSPVVTGGQLTDPGGGALAGVALLLGDTTTDATTGRVDLIYGGGSNNTLLGMTADPTILTIPVFGGINASSTLLITDDGGAINATAVALVSGTTYVVEVVSDPVAISATLYQADGTTVIATVSASTSPTTATKIAAGLSPLLYAGDPSSAWDNYLASSATLGGAPPVLPSHSDGLQFSITTLRYPGTEPTRVQRLVQFTDGEVGIPINDMRDARVTLSIYDPAVLDALPLERFLLVRYLGKVVFWGPLTDPDWDLPNGTVTLHALGPEFRTVKHFVRIGDVIDGNTVSEGETVQLPITSDGMWDLVTAALNTAGQTTRGVPDLGIERGATGDPGSTSHIDTQRGDQVFGKIQEIADSELGPDFEFDPQELDEGAYAQFNTYEKQGSDKTSTVKLHYGWGLGNLDSYQVTPSGSAVVTHRHTVSQDGHNRGTAAADGPSGRFGPYVEWDTINGNPIGADDTAKDAVLAEIGRGTVLAYGEPPYFISVTIKPAVGGEPTLKYWHSFKVGDVVETVAHKGFYRKKVDARITRVTLSQQSSQRNVLTAVDLVPRILTSGDVTSSED